MKVIDNLKSSVTIDDGVLLVSITSCAILKYT